MPRFVLASASPRRKELLSAILPCFEVEPTDVDEDALTVRDPRETAELLARVKAEAVAARHPDATVLGADTVVALGQLQLAKPVDARDAERMLRLLAGATHRVITGICLIGPTGKRIGSDVTEVTFRELSDEEIEAYVATGESMDKAGSYAIQGGAKGFVEAITGSVSNVIGLPIELLRDWLA